MTAKQIGWAVGAVLFTLSNLVAMAANWSMAANAKVGGMSYLRLEKDSDFRRAVEDVFSEMDHSTLEGSSAFRNAVIDVVEGCHISYGGTNAIKC